MKGILILVLVVVALFAINFDDDEKLAVTKEHDHSQSVVQASPVAKNIPNFSAKTIKGEVVTNEIFAAKKITVVNIWGTFCPPCIGEMPEMGEFARSMPADAQLIGLICDASEGSQQMKKALQITQEAHADFVNIIPDEQLLKFMEGVEAVPTTIFVNSKGEVVGEAIIGANVEAYKDELKKLLKQ
ncbi:MAG: TlpA family protein disulfide reductase [Selenomonadaceae bacterium]|nr:TlpA family protein disulfide reductase [Selenomonadaceae bacterium]